MVVQHNLQASNASRVYNLTNSNISKESEKLSSGYKINTSSDDAAGLSISEKMRKQMRGLNRASTNIEDGISLVQVADGALTETHDMLQRMNELCVQAANGTNSDSDRLNIQNEIDELKSEIDRIAKTTSFNGDIFPLNAKTNIKNVTLVEGGELPDAFSTTDITITNTYKDGIVVDGISYNLGDSITFTDVLVADYINSNGEVEKENALWVTVGGYNYNNVFGAYAGAKTLEEAL